MQQAGASNLAVHTTDIRGTWIVCVGLGFNSWFLMGRSGRVAMIYFDDSGVSSWRDSVLRRILNPAGVERIRDGVEEVKFEPWG